VHLYLSSGRIYITCSSLHELSTHSTQAYYSVARHSGKSASTNVSTISTIAVPIAPHQSSSLAASLSPLQVSCSTMQLQSSTRPQSLPLHIHRLSGVIRSIHSTLTSPLCHRTLTPKSLPIIPGRQLRRGNEHTPQRYRLHEDISPRLTHQIPLQNSRISPMTISKHLLPPLTQL